MVGLTTFPELPTTALAIACLVRVCLFRGCTLMTCLHDQRRQPAAHVFVQAYQQIWPGNGHPDSNDSSDFLTHTELASPLNRLSAGRIRRPSSRMCVAANAGVLCQLGFTHQRYRRCMPT